MLVIVLDNALVVGGLEARCMMLCLLSLIFQPCATNLQSFVDLLMHEFVAVANVKHNFLR